MKTYQIEINEEQRLLLTQACADLAKKLLELDEAEEATEEAELLRGMFEELPQAEAADAPCIHGFCY